MTDTQYSRRQLLTTATVAGATILTGCLDGDGDPDTETPTADDESDADDITLTFEHPETVAVDEVFELTIEGLPETATVDVVLESEFPGLQTATATATVEVSDGEFALRDGTVVGGDVPPTLDVPLPVALVQFLDTSRQRDKNETLTYRIEHDSQTLGSTSLTRDHPKTDWLDSVEAENLVGKLAIPPEASSGPPLLLLHGSGANTLTSAAIRFAAHGYTALALQYFGDPNPIPDDLVEIPLEYVGQAIEWLLDHEATTGDAVGVYGYSRGGELALLTGSEFDRIGAVVSMLGSGFVHEGWEGRGIDGSPANTTSWTRNGEPLDYSPYLHLDEIEDALDNDRREAATIPVEQIDAPVVLVSGADDQLWDSHGLQSVAAERLEEHGGDVTNLVYEDTGHWIPSPYVPVEGTAPEYVGGTLEGNAFASHDHWPHVLNAFETL